MIKKTIPFLIILLLVVIFFYKTIFQGMIAMPGDLLSGAYYPWLEYKYGYEVGVPVKNGLISDVFSQFYVWKKLIVESYARGEIPLWNQYSYSGYPLLANFHSGALYIFNILLIPFKFATGWNLFVASGILGSAITMYFLLKTFKYDSFPSILGSIAYAFSGYSIVWMQFATAGHSLVWIPILILSIEKYFETKKFKWILLISPALFLLTTAGHFQIMVYGYLLLGTYFIFKFINEKSRKFNDIIKFILSIVIGVGMSSVQLLPTLEMSSLSVRFTEHYVDNINYGLIPLKNLITLLAPDFFGNPSTGNYWGFFNYHETMLYIGIPSIVSLIWSLFSFKALNKSEKFFLTVSIVTLLLCLDTYLGRILYLINFPGLSTSVAGRIVAIFTFSTSVLLASFSQKISLEGTKKVIFKLLPIFIIIILTTFVVLKLRGNVQFDQTHLNIIFRNLFIPITLISGFGIVLLLRKYKLFYFGFLLILILDLFRFGWKYTPFVKTDLAFSDTEITNFIKKDTDIFRVEKIFSPLLPPNTWAYYHLMSPSGYDPMAINSYSIKFHKDLAGSNEDVSSRYSEIQKYDSDSLGKYNVKYLLSIKRDEIGVIPGENIDYRIDQKKWKKVFETKAVAILQNTKFTNRAYLKSNSEISDTDYVKIDSYSSQKVFLSYKTFSESNLILLDTWYPGWIVKVNGHEKEIEKYNDVFRSVLIPAGSGNVIFEYKPKSFIYGFYIFVISSLIWIVLIIFNRNIFQGHHQ